MKTTGVPVSPTMRYARVVPLTRAELRTSGAARAPGAPGPPAPGAGAGGGGAEPPPQAASRQSRGTSRILKGWRLPARFATGRSPSRHELPARLDGHLDDDVLRRNCRRGARHAPADRDCLECHPIAEARLRRDLEEPAERSPPRGRQGLGVAARLCERFAERATAADLHAVRLERDARQVGRAGSQDQVDDLADALQVVDHEADGGGRFVAVHLVPVLIVEVGADPKRDGLERLAWEPHPPQGIEDALEESRVATRRIRRIARAAGHPNAELGTLRRQGRLAPTRGDDLCRGPGGCRRNLGEEQGSE